jgi:hypothetical protein
MRIDILFNGKFATSQQFTFRFRCGALAERETDISALACAIAEIAGTHPVFFSDKTYKAQQN